MGLERKAEPAWPVWLGVSRSRKPPPSGSFCSFAEPLSVHGVVLVVTCAAEMKAHSSIVATAFAELIFTPPASKHGHYTKRALANNRAQGLDARWECVARLPLAASTPS